MSHAPPSQPLVYGRIAATIPITDMDKSLHFYMEVLGLQKTFENGDPLGFAILNATTAELHLTLEPHHTPPRTTSPICWCPTPSGLHDHLVAHAVPIIKRLRDADLMVCAASSSPIPTATASTSASASTSAINNERRCRSGVHAR